MSTTNATVPNRTATTTIPAPRLRHEGTFCAVLNAASKGKTRTSQKPCIRCTFNVPCSDGLAYRGGMAQVVKTFTMPDPGSEGFEAAYQDLQRAIDALGIPTEAFDRLVEACNAPLDEQRDAWFRAVSSCVGKRCKVKVSAYSNTSVDASTGEPVTYEGVSVDRVLALNGPFTLASFDVEDQTCEDTNVAQPVDPSQRGSLRHGETDPSVVPGD